MRCDEDGLIDRKRPTRMMRYQTDTNDAPPSKPLVPDCAMIKDVDKDSSSTESVHSNNDDSIKSCAEAPTKRAKVHSKEDTDIELLDDDEPVASPKSVPPISTAIASSANNSSVHVSKSLEISKTCTKVVSLKDLASLEATYGKVPQGKTASSCCGFIQIPLTNQHCVRVDVKKGMWCFCKACNKAINVRDSK